MSIEGNSEGESDPKEQKGPMTTRDIGRLGAKRLREKYGPDYFKNTGRAVGNKNKEKGSDYFREIGKKGGQATARKLKEARGRERLES